MAAALKSRQEEESMTQARLEHLKRASPEYQVRNVPQFLELVVKAVLIYFRHLCPFFLSFSQ